MLTRQQLQANINAMEKQGASQDEIQGWLDSLKAPQTAAQAQPDKPRLQQLGTGIAKGALSTVKGMSSLGEKMLQAPLKAAGMKFDEKTAAEKLIPEKATETKTGWEKAGFMGEQIAEFFIPSGLVTKASKFLQGTGAAIKLAEGGKIAQVVRAGLTRGAPEAASLAGVSTLQTGGDIEEAKTMAKWGFGVPVAMKGLSVLAPNISTLKSVMTGVPKNVFERMKKAPAAYDEALKMIEKTKNPFTDLAQTIGGRINNIRSTARDFFNKSKERARENYAGTVFNLENKIPVLNKTLSDFNLMVKQIRDKAGQFTGEVSVAPTTQTSPFLVGGKSTPELKEIQNVVSKIFNKKLTVDDLFDLQASLRSHLDNAYNAGNTKMISLLNRLTKDTSKFVEEVLPEIKIANSMYSAYYKAMENSFGRKIVNSKGDVLPTAEQFLANLPNANKGILQKHIAELEKEIGVPILDNIVLFKDAQKLNNLFPATGSRTLDILRSFAVKGAGVIGAGSAFTGNLFGAAASGAVVAASSPKLAAKETIAMAKWLNSVKSKVPIPKEVRVLFNRIMGKDLK